MPQQLSNTLETALVTYITTGGLPPTLTAPYMIGLQVGIAEPIVAPTVGAATSGGSVDAGLHEWAVSFVTANGETGLGPVTSAVTVTAGSQTIPLSAIPTGPTGTTARNIYRTKAGQSSPFYLVHQIADNTTTAYTDTTADAGLGAQHSGLNSTGGATGASGGNECADTNYQRLSVSWNAVSGNNPASRTSSANQTYFNKSGTNAGATAAQVVTGFVYYDSSGTPVYIGFDHLPSAKQIAVGSELIVYAGNASASLT